MKPSYTTSQLAQFNELLRLKGVTPERFEIILSSTVLSSILEPGACFDDSDSIRKALRLEPDAAGPASLMIIDVDYAASLETMIAGGGFDWLNPEITPHEFPLNGDGRHRYEAKLFQFESTLPSDAIAAGIAEVDADDPWRIAGIEHLLAFAARYPQEQLTRPIVALGSPTRTAVWGQHSVPYLFRRVTGRSLHLDFNRGWGSFYRFLAVRKV